MGEPVRRARARPCVVTMARVAVVLVVACCAILAAALPPKDLMVKKIIVQRKFLDAGQEAIREARMEVSQTATALDKAMRYADRSANDMKGINALADGKHVMSKNEATRVLKLSNDAQDVLRKGRHGVERSWASLEEDVDRDESAVGGLAAAVDQKELNSRDRGTLKKLKQEDAGKLQQFETAQQK